LAAGGAFTNARTGAKTSKLPQTFGRVTAPLAPNRPLHAGILTLIKSLVLNY